MPIVLLAGMLPAPAAATGSRSVAAWLPYWDHDRGLDAIKSNGDQFGEVSPFWYRLAPSGAVEAYSGAGSATVRDAIKGAGALILPTISNEFDRDRVAAVIGDSGRRAAHVQALVSLTTSQGYDGFDIDYEGLAAGDRANFTSFVGELGAAMRAAGKLLSVTVHPKTSEPGTWDGPQAQDYVAIGAASDRVRIMAYDYHWATSEAGPIAPASWVDAVAAFAAKTITPSKVQLGLPLYGYDWVGKQGNGVTYEQVQALIAKHQPTLQWSSTDQEPWFTYRDAAGVTHTVWFADRRSTDMRLGSVTKHGLRGVVFWRLGREDAGVWTGTRNAFGSGTAPPAPAPADTTAPSVAITSPKPNAHLSLPSQTITYTASDNVGVARAELYVNGKLTYADTTGRGNFTVPTSSLPRGRHLFTVRVLDAAGNAAASNVYLKR
ncbi:MAG TPA: glycosyl hydrolase family 18 protein [Actinomycetota bacterium]|nr:glycosyl hydrolase family 18 protein [Actinomycetota bacterium]